MLRRCWHKAKTALGSSAAEEALAAEEEAAAADDADAVAVPTPWPLPLPLPLAPPCCCCSAPGGLRGRQTASRQASTRKTAPAAAASPTIWSPAAQRLASGEGPIGVKGHCAMDGHSAAHAPSGSTGAKDRCDTQQHSGRADTATSYSAGATQRHGEEGREGEGARDDVRQSMPREPREPRELHRRSRRSGAGGGRSDGRLAWPHP